MTANAREFLSMKPKSNHRSPGRVTLHRLGVLALALILAGCGGGSSSGSGSTGSGSGSGSAATVASISISPTSASVSVGATEPFTATATDASGNAISGVTFTWSSSSTGVATINSSGVATAVAAGTTNITASASGITSSAATLTVVSALGVSTTTLPGATVGSAYSATLHATGGKTPYTWSISSGSLPSGLTLAASTGVISGSPTTAGTSHFTVKVTDSTSPAATATANLSITVSTATAGAVSLLSGQYAFQVSGYDSAVVGSLTLDGAGHVTGGIEDIRSLSTSMSGAAIAIGSGTYTVTSDDRGTLSYTDANGNSFEFAVALGGVSAGVATHGQMIEFDSNPLQMSGTLALQSSAAFSASALSGGYAFQSWGWDTSSGPDVTVGSFTASAGAISNGLFDQNDAGTVNSAVAFTGTIGTIDSHGRGTVTLGTGSTFDVYIISAGSAYSISDMSDPYVQSGLMLQQVGGPFGSGALSGDTIFENRSENGVPAPHAGLGQIVFGSGGTFTGTFDTNDSGTVTLLQTGTGTWSITSASNGRILTTPNGAHTSVGYLIAPNEAFTTTETSGVVPDIGTIDPQAAGPFANTSLSGTYSFGTLPSLSPPETGANIAYNIESGMLSFDGAGNMSVTYDVNSSGALVAGATATDTYSVASDGRATQGSGSDVIWIVSATKAYALQISQGQPSSDNPVIFVFQK